MIDFERFWSGDVRLHILGQVDISEEAVAASSDGRIPAEFTYSVKWSETPTPYEKRMDKYRKYQFMPQLLEVGLQ